MSAVLADTHAAICYLTEPGKLSAAAMAALDGAAANGQRVYLASISLVVARYLVEKGKLDKRVLERINLALDDPTAALALVPLDLAVARAIEHIPRSTVPTCRIALLQQLRST